MRMKKLLVALLALLTFSSCTKCTKKVVTTDLVVENVISTDKQYMFNFNKYDGDYRWFETCIVLKDFLDGECDGTIAGISNVFQVVEEKDKGADTFVILCTHTPDTTAYEVKHGFWVEDFPMNDEDIKVTFKQAFEKINEVNLPKPHSKHCVLRKQVGPADCHPQYIFGNTHAQIYVDAVTGDVTDKNPAFPDEFSVPLGEWP